MGFVMSENKLKEHTEFLANTVSDQELIAMKALIKCGWEISIWPWLEDAEAGFENRAMIAVCKKNEK
jgi:hypothetical protein